MSVTGIVLAGGRGTRFGGPKLAAELEGRSILSRSIDALSKVASEVLVAGPELPELLPEPREVPGARVHDAVLFRLVADSIPFEGPLAALAGALGEARGAVAVVVGGDMPRLVPEVLGSMVARLMADSTIDAVVLGAPGSASSAPGHTEPRRQVLPMALRIAAASTVAREVLDAGDRSLRALLDHLACDEIPPATWLTLDPSAETLLDVDTRFDLDRLRPPGSAGDLA